MTDLIHAVARVRAREDRLLTASHVLRMIEAASFSEAYSVLDDLGYANEVSRQRDTGDFEEVLENTLHETLYIFTQFELGEKLHVLTVLGNIQNFKLALKSFQKGEELSDSDESEISDMLISYASISPEKVIALVFSETGDAHLLSAISRFKAEKGNEKMEQLIEKFFFDQAVEIAGRDKFLLSYLKLISSSEELKTDFVRLEKDELIAKYKSSEFSGLIQSGLKKIEKSGNFSSLEVIFDERNLQFLQKEARGEIDGYAPLFSYFWKQERNTRVIRSILLAKRNGISPEKIRGEYDTFIF